MEKRRKAEDSMDTLIGQILLEMRKERQVTEKKLCEGICKVFAYSNYEWRERVPDFLTLNYILERLGHGITGLTAYLSEEELDYIRWKNEAEKILRKKEWIKLNEIRKKEPKKCNSLYEKVVNVLEIDTNYDSAKISYAGKTGWVYSSVLRLGD